MVPKRCQKVIKIERKNISENIPKKIPKRIRKRNSKGTENELSSLPKYHKKVKTERDVISPSAGVRGTPALHEGPPEAVDPASKDGSSPGIPQSPRLDQSWPFLHYKTSFKKHLKIQKIMKRNIKNNLKMEPIFCESRTLNKQQKTLRKESPKPCQNLTQHLLNIPPSRPQHLCKKLFYLSKTIFFKF